MELDSRRVRRVAGGVGSVGVISGQAVVKGAEMNQQMMVNIDMLQKSCENFDFAAQRLTEVCSETVKIATLASNTLNDMNHKLQSRADAADSMRVKKA